MPLFEKCFGNETCPNRERSAVGCFAPKDAADDTPAEQDCPIPDNACCKELATTNDRTYILTTGGIEIDTE